MKVQKNQLRSCPPLMSDRGATCLPLRELQQFSGDISHSDLMEFSLCVVGITGELEPTERQEYTPDRAHTRTPRSREGSGGGTWRNAPFGSAVSALHLWVM